MNEVKLHYDDVSIVPDIVTNIDSRKNCNPYINGMLPIFASPMGSVLDENNWKYFYDNKINVVIPRTVPFDKRINLINEIFIVNESEYKPFIAFSLDEADQLFIVNKNLKKRNLEKRGCVIRICIDIANGHMNKLISLIKDIKLKFGSTVEVMAGNIANPKTYLEYELAGCDYVRVTIGTGGACLTASNTGVFYPPFSLLKDIDEVRRRINGKCKVIADGGIKVYRDIQKALIYADYVMIGSVFNRCIESAGETTYGKSYINIFGKKVRNYLVDLFRYGKKVKKEDYQKVMSEIKKGNLEVYKLFYGMSTKFAQMQTNNIEDKCQLKTSEGIIKKQLVEYSLPQWVENEESYLRSAMSYTNSLTLNDYKKSEWVQVTGINHNR